MSKCRPRRLTLPGRRLPVGAGATKLPFTEKRGLPDGRFRRTLRTAPLGQKLKIDCPGSVAEDWLEVAISTETGVVAAIGVLPSMRFESLADSECLRIPPSR